MATDMGVEGSLASRTYNSVSNYFSYVYSFSSFFQWKHLREYFTWSAFAKWLLFGTSTYGAYRLYMYVKQKKQFVRKDLVFESN